MKSEKSLRCPVCRASFRSKAVCSRCGADLTPLMTLAARAYRQRQMARLALHRRDFSQALRLAAEAQEICYTQKGRALYLIARFCRETM